MEQQKEPGLSAPLQTIATSAQFATFSDEEPIKSINDITSKEIIQKAKLAQIVDERDKLPLYKKLAACRGRNVTVIIDAIDDEPYISSQTAPIIHFQNQLKEGIYLAMKAMETKKCRVEVYSEMHGLESKIPRMIGNIPVHRVGGVYPLSIKENESYIKKSGKLYVYLGSMAMVHLYRAIYEHRLQETTIVTVSGNCIANPCNIEAGFDIPVTDLLDRCGLIQTPDRIVVGTSMTGTSIEDTDETFVTVDTGAVLALVTRQKNRNYRCIRCGRCSSVCPIQLNPLQIADHIKLDLHEQLEKLDCKSCIQCMCCSFECPAKINLAAMIAAYNKRRAQQ